MGWLGLICSSFLMVFATILFSPINFHPETRALNLIPFSWMGTVDDWNQFLVEKIPNVLLFVPFGFFLPIVFPKMRHFYKTALISFLVTFGIEFIQYFIGRSSDIDDILTNLLGAVIGYFLFRILDAIFHHTEFWSLLLGRGKTR